MNFNILNENGGFGRIVMHEAKQTENGIVLRNIIAIGDYLNSSAMLKSEIEELGITLSIQKIIPERSNPFGDNLEKLKELIIYEALLPKSMTYEPNLTNPEYWRNILIDDKVIAKTFIKLGQYTDILKP